MTDLYGDGAIDILRCTDQNEEKVIRSLIHKIKSLETENKNLVIQNINLILDHKEQLHKVKASHAEHIEYMDEVARKGSLQIRCRSCNEFYELPCELSEMSHEGNYCNSGHGGAYHCAP